MLLLLGNLAVTSLALLSAMKHAVQVQETEGMHFCLHMGFQPPKPLRHSKMLAQCCWQTLDALTLIIATCHNWKPAEAAVITARKHIKQHTCNLSLVSSISGAPRNSING